MFIGSWLGDWLSDWLSDCLTNSSAKGINGVART
jgi:hypothetical protein